VNTTEPFVEFSNGTTPYVAPPDWVVSKISGECQSDVVGKMEVEREKKKNTGCTFDAHHGHELEPVGRECV
jgi:hypothetical protein